MVCVLPGLSISKVLHRTSNCRGFYDLFKDPVAYVQSGDVITVEVITHEAGNEYAKMIQVSLQLFGQAPRLASLYCHPQGTTLFLFTGCFQSIGPHAHITL